MGRDREKQVVWIEDEHGLRELAGRLMRHRRFSLDTEQDAFHAYRAKVCLIQIRVGGREYVVDALRLRDLSALAEPLAAEDRITIVHAAENDVDLLRRGFGLEVRGLFDTMAAAQRLGYTKCGLAGLVKAHFGIQLEKKYQRSDWRRRPLSAEQIAYAARDVRFLPRLFRILSRELNAAGVGDEAARDFRRIERARHKPRRTRVDDYRRISGVSDLAPPAMDMFRVLHALRRRVASRDDRALFRVCGDNALLAIAKAAPKNAESLEAIRGVPSRFKKKEGEQILALLDAVRTRGARRATSRESTRRIAASKGRRPSPRRSAISRTES